MVKKSKRLLVAILVAGQMGLGTPAYGSSSGEWETFMRQQMDVVIRTHFAFLGQDFTDVSYAIALAMRSRAVRLLSLQERLGEVSRDLQSGQATDGRLLRRAALIQMEAELLVAAQRRDLATYRRLEALRAGQCEPTRLDRFSDEFDAACLVNTNAIVSGLVASINGLERGGAMPQVKFTLDTGNGNFSLNQGVASSNWQDMVANGAAAGGAAIGSVVPGVGTAIGAAVGFIVGTAICAIFGSRDYERIRQYREEIRNITSALDRLKGQSSKDILRASCKAIFENPKLAEPLGHMEEVVSGASATSEKAAGILRAMVAGIEQGYQVALATLIRDDLPTFEKRFEIAFRRFLESQANASAESKDFVEKEILPDVSRLKSLQLSAADRQKAQHELWEKLIDGDVRFSGDGGFCFNPGAPPRDELLYWGPASAAVVDYLREGGR